MSHLLPEPGSSGRLGEPCDRRAIPASTGNNKVRATRSNRGLESPQGTLPLVLAFMMAVCFYCITTRGGGYRVPKESGRGASQKLSQANWNHSLQSESTFLKGKMEIAIRTTT